MYKGIYMTEGITESYIEEVNNFIRSFESYEPRFDIQTSGSTGAPKTISFSKNQVIASAQFTGAFFQFNSTDAVLLNLSPRFVAGKLMIARALTYKMKLLLAPVSENPLLHMDKFPFPIKLAAFVPHQVEAILNNERTRNLYNQIEHVLIGGTHIHPQLEKHIARQNNKAWASFGMTETLTHIALRLIDGKTKDYTCLPGYQISTDQNQCLVVEPNAVVEKQLFTHDIIELTTQNSFHWLGRFDHVINSGGIKIFPETDEKLIASLLSDHPFYISSASDVKYGEIPVLVVENLSLSSAQTDHLLASIAAILPAYHAPKKIITLQNFQRTANGKLIRTKF
ncbi:MAG: AMP-binding protein [Crocinitomicaceae bacterium]|nr:AMP-binding protein [Crocinitomicaceae bacterium]